MTIDTIYFLFTAQPFMCSIALFSIVLLVFFGVMAWKSPFFPPTILALPLFLVVFAWAGVSWYQREAEDTAAALDMIRHNTVAEIQHDTFDITFIAVLAPQPDILGKSVAPYPPALAIHLPLRDARQLDAYLKKHPDLQISPNVRQSEPFHYDKFGYTNLCLKYYTQATPENP